MLKLTGSLMIAAVCVMYGFSSADRLRRRRDFLTSFLTSLSVLETEISFKRHALAEIFERLDDKALLGLYEHCRKGIERDGIRSAWSDAANAASDAAGLKPSEREAVLSLGTELGMSDISGQRAAIGRTRELTAALAGAAADDYKRLGRAYRGCGISAGIFFVLMLI